MCTGVETVKQSLKSIETNQGMFHNLNAQHHKGNKQVSELKKKAKFKVYQAPN